jgi:ubiquitin conjugation factor E4 B
MTRGDIESATSSLRGTLRGVQVCRFPSSAGVCCPVTDDQFRNIFKTSLYQILYRIVTSGASARESFLALLNSVAKLNAKRSAMRVDPRMVSTHGFIINLHTVLLSFATPFLDSQYSKVRYCHDECYLISTTDELENR